MEWKAGIILAAHLLAVGYADLPAGCTPLGGQAYSTVDPGTFFPENSELGGIIPPGRMGDWRDEYSIPTQHFVINQIKPDGRSAVRLMPYSAWPAVDGVTYDAYTMERWSEEPRSDTMQQQTPVDKDEPYSPVLSVGTNMKQLVSGPDGNPKSTFTGLSGVKVGIDKSKDPVWTGFGEMWGTFMYSSNQGSMEVPWVRGSALITHKFTNADPIVLPYCLSSVNGETLTGYSCPTERDVSDPGEGFLEGSCSGGTLHMILHATKAVELSAVQWAAAPSSQWPSGMNTCGEECQISEDGLTVDIYIGGASGTMSFAVNVIGKYVIPPDWQANPMQTTCTGRHHGSYIAEPSTQRLAMCEDQGTDMSFCHTPSCDLVDSVNNFQLVIELGTPIASVDQIQFAVDEASSWANPSPMLTCGVNIVCTMSADGTTITYATTLNEASVKYAVNVIGRYVKPEGDWQNNPYQYNCGDDTGTTSSPGTTTTSNPGAGLTPGTKFVLELDEPQGKLPDQTRKFVLYFSEEMAPSSNPSTGITFTPTAGGSFNGLMQLAYAGANPRGDFSGTNYFDQYAGVYSYEPQTDFCVLDGKAYLDFNWNKHDINGATSSGDLIMVTMPHHEGVLVDAPLQDSPFTFKAAVGDSWLLEMDAPPSAMDPDPAKVADVQNNPDWLNTIMATIPLDANNQNMDLDCDSGSYWGGKAIGRVARLASISRSFGTNDYVQLDQQLVRCLDRWLRINDTLSDGNKFLYDTVYGGLLLRSVPEGEPIDLGGNYGFPAYSDHHFHLGYWVYAMGYYAKYYPSWATSSDRRERIVSLARDVGNPSTADKYFPVVRHKDFYIGHSWATGILGGERQQESSSEALDCYHGLAALGQALGDSAMEQTGQVMLAMEMLSVRHYYNVRPSNQYYFPPYLQTYGTIGMWSEDSVFMYTLNWPCSPEEFPMRHACLVGIQILPITAVSYLYMDQEWATSVYNVCSWSIDPQSAPGADRIDPSILEPVATGWGAFCQAIMAKKDASAFNDADAYLNNLGINDFDSGTTKSSTLLWLYGDT